MFIETFVLLHNNVTLFEYCFHHPYQYFYEDILLENDQAIYSNFRFIFKFLFIIFVFDKNSKQFEFFVCFIFLEDPINNHELTDCEIIELLDIEILVNF